MKVEPGAITDDASPMDLSQWDSVRHMNVVLAIENEFGIEFNDAELATLKSVSVIATAVERHIGA